jgi:competence protein ComGC
MLFFDKYPALVLKAEFSEKTAADDLKKLVDSFKNMAEIMIAAKEKEEDEKISRAGALDLLNPELLGMKAALGAGKTLLGSLETTSDASSAELKIKIPEEFQAFLKPAHLPIIAGVTGVLAAIAIPNFTKARNDAQLKACKSNMMTIEGACELYQMENGTPAMITLNELVEKKYLKKKPVCMAKKDEPVEYKITIGENFDVECPIHGKLSAFSK